MTPGTPTTSAEVRAELVQALVLDLIGPIDDPGRTDERLEQAPSRWSESKGSRALSRRCGRVSS